MSEAISYHPSYPHISGSSSSLSHSKTPPPLLESSLSSSDQYSPTAVEPEAQTSPEYNVDPMSLTIPNPFVDPSRVHIPHEVKYDGTARVQVNPSNLGWRADIQPAPLASVASGHHTSDFHRPNPGVPSGNEVCPQSSLRSQDTNRSPRQKGKINKEAAPAPAGKDRRQKRLERNRESARLSRRRRKQYLEILETKVAELSDEMDRGRRQHVSEALSTIQSKRASGVEDPGLLRTSNELRLASTFRSQQMDSLCTPPSTKFMLWLTLQNDVYFRGGRSPSERLSAARIGERMIQNGNDKVAPVQSMWPLFCNEVNLSYDQEERVRAFQKSYLAAKEAWLERHTAYASSLTIKSTHEALQAVSFRLSQRERGTAGILSAEQRTKLASFVGNHRSALKERLENQPKAFDGYYQTSKDQHVAANLYVSNHRLQSVLKTIPRSAPLVTGLALKKLSRRPSFESLGVVQGDRNEDDERGISRDYSFASSGSLKRSASEMSMDGEERPQVQQISPEEAESIALPHVESILGHLKPIMPVPKPAPPALIQQIPRPVPPRTVCSAPALHHSDSAQAAAETVVPTPVTSTDPPMVATGTVEGAPVSVAAVDPSASEEPVQKHQRNSSFFPPHLNVVPEELWPSADSVAEEFLMSLADEDWAIGEGVDMEV